MVVQQNDNLQSITANSNGFWARSPLERRGLGGNDHDDKGTLTNKNMPRPPYNNLLYVRTVLYLTLNIGHRAVPRFRVSPIAVLISGAFIY